MEAVVENYVLCHHAENSGNDDDLPFANSD